MRRAEIALAIAGVALGGCATFAPALPDKPMFRDPRLPVAAAAAQVVPGRSTKAEVAAALGEPEALRFDNGFEVWVYRARPARAARAELVVLFGPDGVARKMRLRPGPAAD